MWFGKDMTGSFHDKFVVKCGLKHMIHDEVLT
jgi:hypothetical protein